MIIIHAVNDRIAAADGRRPGTDDRHHRNTPFLRSSVKEVLKQSPKPAIIAGMVDERQPADNVVPLPPRRERLTEIVKEIAADDARWFLVVQPDGSKGVTWNWLINRRQVKLCLKEGYVLDEHATRDEHGFWRFRIARVCAGINVTIDVALESKGALPKLYVLKLNGEDRWPPL